MLKICLAASYLIFALLSLLPASAGSWLQHGVKSHHPLLLSPLCLSGPSQKKRQRNGMCSPQSSVVSLSFLVERVPDLLVDRLEISMCRWARCSEWEVRIWGRHGWSRCWERATSRPAWTTAPSRRASATCSAWTVCGMLSVPTA